MDVVAFCATLVALTVLFIVVNVFFSKFQKRQYKTAPPGTKNVPGIDSVFYGNVALFLNRHRIIEFITEFSTQHGTTCKIPTVHLGDIILVAEPESAEHILKTNFENYPKGKLLCEYLFDLLGKGIFASDGEQWRSQRKTFSHLFKVKNLKGLMHSTFKAHSERVVQCLQRYDGKEKGLDMQNLFYRFTFDSIGVIAFGKDLDSLSHESPVLDAFNYAAAATSQRLSWPLWKFTPDSKFNQSLKTLNEFAYSLIKERRKELQENSKIEREDILTAYLQHTSIDDEALRDVILNFLIAGRDTTSQTLTWFFYLLANNPEVEKKLLEEIDTLEGELPSYRQLKDTSRLRYLHGVIMETLRLYPPVPFDPKSAKEGDLLPNNYWIPQGSLVIWSAWVMGRHSKYWEFPETLIPERWFKGGEAEMKHPYLYIPFQAGPRVCLGKEMALMEAKICALKILQNFRLRLVAEQPPIEPVFAVTLNTRANSMFFSVESRRSSLKSEME